MSVSRKRLFLDLETSYNKGIFWRAGWKQTIMPDNILEERRIICVSYKWEGSNKVHTIKWDKNQCDKKLLEKFLPIFNRADEVVAHNSDRFDIKWLRTRALFHRVPMSPYVKSIDTLKLAKSGFYFNSNKLDYIAKFTGVGEKLATGGLQLWVDIVEHKSAKAMRKMVEYCEQDVVVLEKVYNEFKNYTRHKYNYAVAAGYGKHCCPECGSDNIWYNKKYVTASGTIKHYVKCGECEKPFGFNNKTYQDWLQYKMTNGIK